MDVLSQYSYFTDEQRAALTHALTTGDNMSVRSTAGSGKSKLIEAIGNLLAIAAPWLVLVAVAAASAAKLVATLPTFWKENVVGSATGDTIVPADSQLLPASAGGGQRLELNLPQAVHTGAYSEYQTSNIGEYQNATDFKKAIQTFQIRMGLPQSQQ